MLKYYFFTIYERIDVKSLALAFFIRTERSQTLKVIKKADRTRLWFPAYLTELKARFSCEDRTCKFFHTCENDLSRT